MNDGLPPSRVGGAAGLWLVQLVVAAIACWLMFLSQLSIASCSGYSCDYATYSAALTSFNIGAVVVLVATALGIFAFRRRGRAILWFPILGLALIIALGTVAYALSRAALDLPLFGSRV